MNEVTLVVLATVSVALGLRVAAAAGWRKGRRKVGSPLPRESKCIYLDYAATCPIYADCADAMVPYLYSHWGNPSSGHAYGGPCRDAVAAARESIRALLNARDSSEIVWCSCGSEADNWALVGSLRARRPSRRHVVVSTIEHPAILACVDALVAAGECVATKVGCDGAGLVSARDVAAAVRPGETAVVSIMLANNEVGAVQDVGAVCRAVRAVDPEAWVHTDAAQAVGKIDVDVQALGVDMLTVVGHKFGAPKGVAALYTRRDLPNMLLGGGQERGRRAGTEAVPNLVAMGEAARVWLEQGPEIRAHSERMRDRLRRRLETKLADLETAVNGPLGAKEFSHAALPNVLSFSVNGIRAFEVLGDLRDTVAASASAACHTGSTSVSAVLEAIQVPTPYAIGTLRLSVGRHTTASEVDRAADLIAEAVRAHYTNKRD
ncbi:hypothetical protein CTAYLR_000188 [Chrysophaeum taylorii]|uniref:Aminotransferase class V domain-containing protein n=1 Tax=Chrysophaeum taylorii TaxID=2483200 RepID=A0AAD7XJ29_9STRA|nr:hypothetical protein CTAYLR_000188 [Chrysophaeum taylorii]